MIKLRYSLLATAVFLSACGGGSDDNTPTQTPTPTPAPTPTNEAPTITSDALTTATEDVEYEYRVTATDDTTQTLTFVLDGQPDGMVISDEGLISWTPTEGVLTSGDVTVTVSDGNGDDALSTSQTFNVTVTPVNDQLVLAAEDATESVDSGSEFNYQISVSDVDDENDGTGISFEILSGPDGLNVSDTGLIQWTPSVTESTDYDISISVADGGEDNTSPITFTLELSVLYYQAITGNVVNYFTGEEIASAELKVANGTDVVSTLSSDENGEFNFRILDTLLAQSNTVTTNIEGYAEQSISLSSDQYGLFQTISLVPSNTTISFDPQQEASISVDDMVLVSFPANSLVREDGEPIEGNVDVQVTVIDPSIDIELMPGEMLTVVDGEDSLIESFGAIDVRLHDAGGNAVDLADGMESQIRIPIPSGSNAPDTIPLYYYDTTLGRWIEEGTATKTVEDGTELYVGDVSHFTTWNADRVFETVFVEGCVINEANEPVANARLRAEGVNYNGSSSAMTDDEGNFRIAVRINSQVFLSGAQGSQTRTQVITTSDEDLLLEGCIELAEAASTIQLTWGENPRDLDSHLYGPSDSEGGEFHVYFANRTVTVGDSQIFLDVDDTRSFGPEIITIPAFPFAGRYQYIVYQYSGSSDIQASPARIELNLQSRISIFSPPEGSPTRYWHVFDIVVDQEGNVTLEEMNAWLNSFDDRLPATPEAAKKDVRSSYNPLREAIADKYYDWAN